MKIFYIIILIISISEISYSQRYYDTTQSNQYRFTIQQSDDDGLWFELFHPKDLTVPEKVYCIFLPMERILYFPDMNTAFIWEDLGEHPRKLILARTRRNN